MHVQGGMLRCFWHPSAVLLLAVLAVLLLLMLCGVAAGPLLPAVKVSPHSCCLSCGGRHVTLAHCCSCARWR